MILGYCRVSTEKAEQDTSVRAQKEALKAAGCFKIVQERRSAFKDQRRPGWESCKEMIASGLVTKFVVVSLSRASRRQETSQMSELCNQYGVEFVALTGGPVDVSTPEGLLNVGIQDTVNRFDSMLKSTRVKQGQEARRRAGSTACGRVPFGYKYDGTKPVPDPKQWGKAQQLWAELEACEFRANHILRHGHKTKWKFSNSGLYRWMANPILKGVVGYSDHTCEPLVSAEAWERCQQIRSARSFCNSRAPRQLRLFSGLVTCEKCSAPLNYAMGGNKWRLKCMRPACEWYGKGLAEFKVRDQVLQVLRDSVDEMAAAAAAYSPRSNIQTEDQIEAQKSLDMILELQAKGVEVSKKSISDLRARLAVREASLRPNWSHWADLIRQRDLLERMTDAELRPVLTELVEETLYVGDPTRVEIRLRAHP